MTDFDSAAEEDSATDDSGTTRRQVLAGAAGASSLPLWATRSEAVAAAYQRNHGDDVPTMSGPTATTADMGGLYMREDVWEDITIDLSVRAYTGDDHLPNGMLSMDIQLGPFEASTSLAPGEARQLAKRLMQAANDAEVLTHAKRKDDEQKRAP